jgi:glycosyltransferase involved in cell wall biosynthesis
VPTYNRADSLARTIKAILGQTFQDFEIVVGDDASSDHTSETVRKFTDPRIRYIRNQTNLGIYGNWNALIEKARGRFICIYHDHDTYLPTIVERSFALIDHYSDMSFVHTAIVLVDKAGVPIEVFANEFDEVMTGRGLRQRFSRTTRNTLCAASTMVRRDAYATAGPFDSRYGLATDRHMWFRLAETGTVGYIREPQALILGRSRGDPTERFTLNDLLGSYQISVEGLRELWPPTSLERWKAESALRQEVQRDLFVALIKAIVFGSRAEVAERATIVMSAMTSRQTRLARALLAAPVRPVIRVLAGRAYERRLAARQVRAIDFVRASPVLRQYLPSQYR